MERSVCTRRQFLGGGLAVLAACSRGFAATPGYWYYLGPWCWIRRPQQGYWSAPPGTVGAIDLARHADFLRPGRDRLLGFFATTRALDARYVLLGHGDLRTLPSTQAMRARFGAFSDYRIRPEGTTLLALVRDCLLVHADARGEDRWKPLIPTTESRLEMHLGGHGIILSEPFQWNIHPYTGRLQEVIQADLSHLVRPLEQGAVSLRTVQKILGNLLLRYPGVEWRTLVPSSLRHDIPGPLPPDTTIQDNFNRTDSTVLGTSSDTKFVWNEIDDGLKILTNQVVGDGSPTGTYGRARAEYDLSSSDHATQAQVGVITAGGYSGILTRYSTAAETYYSAQIKGTGVPEHISNLYKVIAGSQTLLDGPSTIAGAVGPKLYYFSASGSTLLVTFDGTTRHNITDTSITGNYRGGIEVQTAVFSSPGTDDYQGADLTFTLVGQWGRHFHRPR